MEPKKITTASALFKNYPERVEKRRYGKAHVVQYRIKGDDIDD